jgi:hypothetical protein
MPIPVSQSVYDQIVAHRDSAATNAANSAATISAEIANQAIYAAQAAELQTILDELEVP